MKIKRVPTILFFIVWFLLSCGIVQGQDGKSRVITISYSGSNSRETITTEFADEWLLQPDDQLNMKLLQASFAMAAAGFRAKEFDISQRDHDILDFLTQAGFHDIQTDDYHVLTSRHTIGSAFGHKTIGDETLIAVSISGNNYTNEWLSNLTIDNDRRAAGFNSAANKVTVRLDQYIHDHHLSGNLRLWAAGFSRGAAVTNLFVASPTQFFATVNASATVLSQFEVNIDANTPDNTTITFTHDIAETDNQQDADTYTFTITVVNGGSSEVSLVDVSRFVNVISGNGDNDVNPGETIKISIYSQNEGETDAHNVISSLTSTSPYSSIASPIITFPLMAPGVNQLSQYDVVINANTPNGTEIPFTHQLTDGTHNFSENFTVLVVSTVGINENGQSLITIFPNPTTDFININLNNTMATQAVIYDVYGKKINEEALTETDNRINVSELANGVYFIKIFNEGQIVSTTKFIKK